MVVGCVRKQVRQEFGGDKCAKSVYFWRDGKNSRSLHFAALRSG
jgi:hypothetical protein